MLPVSTHLVFTTPKEAHNTILSISQKKELRHTEVNSLPKVTHLASGAPIGDYSGSVCGND